MIEPPGSPEKNRSSATKPTATVIQRYKLPHPRLKFGNADKIVISRKMKYVSAWKSDECQFFSAIINWAISSGTNANQLRMLQLNGGNAKIRSTAETIER